MLTPNEQATVDRAKQLLEWTHYDQAGEGDQRLTDARALAHGTLEIAEALLAERTARSALKERCETQQAILGEHAYAAMNEPDGEP